jgi:hypothetical protein
VLVEMLVLMMVQIVILIQHQLQAEDTSDKVVDLAAEAVKLILELLEVLVMREDIHQLKETMVVTETHT